MRANPLNWPSSKLGPWIATGAVRAIGPLRHHAFEPHVAGGPEQVGTDLTLLERGDENPVGLALEQTHEALLAQRASTAPVGLLS